MKGKFMIIAALLGALTFGACVDTEESSSVKAIRDAKAEQLKSVATLNNAKAQAEATIAAAEAQLAAAQAQLLAAQAAKVQAEAAAINAETEAQKIANEQAAAEAELAIAKAEAEIAFIMAKLEMDLITYQTNLLNAKLAFNAAMQKLADDEKKNLEGIYTKYNAALSNLAAMTAKKIELNADIAEFQADIAEHEATIESLTAEDAQAAWDAAVKAAEKAVADATTDVNNKQKKADSAAALVEELRALGAVSYIELGTEVNNALKAMNAASDAKLLASKKANAASDVASDLYGEFWANDTEFQAAWNEFQSANRELLYPGYDNGNSWVSLQAVGRQFTRRQFKVGVDEDGNDMYERYYSFLPVTWDTTTQTIVELTADDAVALYTGQYAYSGNNIYEWSDDKYDSNFDYDMAQPNEVFADGATTYVAEVNEYIEATYGIKVKNLTEKYNIALANVTAYVATQGAAAVNLLSQLQTYEATEASLKATIASKLATLATLQQQLKVYEGVTETAAITAAKKVINDQITAINSDLNKTNADVTKAGLNYQLTDVQGKITALKANYNFTAYNTAKDALDVATFEYDYIKAVANEAAVALEAAVAATDHIAAADAYNEAAAAACAAQYASKDANQAYSDAYSKWSTLNTDYNDTTKWGDIAYDAPRLSVMLEDAKAAAVKANTALGTAKTKLATAQANWDAISAMTEEEIAAALEMTLENMIKYYEDQIEACEAEIEALEAAIVLLDQKITVEEIYAENYAAILEDALADAE